MPTGPSHYRMNLSGDPLGKHTITEVECRCALGSDHDEAGTVFNEVFDSDDHGGSESLSVHDAADIWLSHGMDEDYTFSYSEDELRRAAGIG